MIKCTKCGAEHPDGSKFCSSCGAKLEIPKPLQFNDNVIAGDVDMSTHTNVVNNYNSTTNVYQSVETRAFKCKMCGEPLEVDAKKKVIICDHCNSPQTVPKIDDERRAHMYDRANHFRRNKDFDKAMGIYEQLLDEDNTDAEAYWSIVLCRYGIEYVKDPTSRKRIPTVNRTQYNSIFNDEDYKSALLYADSDQRSVYESEAKVINDIQKSILAISKKEDPFDIFISYKETDGNDNRTIDSVLAQELYDFLTKEGFKVFFSRVTLEKIIGNYEPYIFAALNSSKVMIVLGTTSEHLNAPWVKNEWSRFIALRKNDPTREIAVLFKNMSPRELPEELSIFQAKDMNQVGYKQDLVHSIKKVVQVDEPTPAVAVSKEAPTAKGNSATAPLLKRVFMFLEDSKWADANEYCERVLDSDPECADAYLGKLMAEYQVHTKEGLKNCAKPFDNSDNYKKAIRFGNDQLRSDLKGYIAYINTRTETARLDGIYKQAHSYMNSGNYKAAIDLFKSIIQYKDSASLIEKCVENHNAALYAQALKAMNSAQSENDYKNAAAQFRALSLVHYKDSATLADKCQENADNARKDAIFSKAKGLISHRNMNSYKEAIKLLQSIPGWKNSDEQIAFCESKIAELKAKDENERKERERQAELDRQRHEREVEEARIAEERQKKRKKRRKTIIGLIITLVVIGLIAGMFIFYKNITKETAFTVGAIAAAIIATILCICVWISGEGAGAGCGTWIVSYLIAGIILVLISWGIWSLVHINDPPILVNGEEVDSDVLQSITLNIDKTEATVGDTISLSFTTNPSNPQKALVAAGETESYDAKCIEYYVRVNGEDKKLSTRETSIEYKIEQIGEIVFWAKYCAHNGCDGTYDVVSPEVTVTVKGNVISSVSDLSKLNNSSEAFELASDIDMSGVTFTPIEGFTGTLDGKGYSIKNLSINTSQSNVGFFSTLSGTVNNIKFENASITVTGNQENVGILCGTLQGTASGISVSGAVTADSSKNVGGVIGYCNKIDSFSMTNITSSADVSASTNVGGLIGNWTATTSSYNSTYTLELSRFESSGTVVASENYVGGIAGYMRFEAGNVYNVYMSEFKNTGNISGKTYVGGLIGYGSTDSSESYVKNSSSSGAITAEAYVGCIAGQLSSITVDNCSNEGSTLEATKYITDGGNKYAFVGGYVGRGYLAKNCTNTVDIDYTSDGRYVGGIIGFTDAIVSTSLENLKNTADITGQEHVGGIFGEWSAVTSSYNSTYTLELTEFENTGVITARGNYVGGIAGYMRFDAGNVYNVYISEFKNSGDVSGKTYVGGLIGYGSTDSSESYVKDSSCSAGITAEAYVGCIAGQLNSITVDNCSNEGSTLEATKYITDDGDKYAFVGGYVGRGYLAKNCTNTVDIDYTSDGRYVGGIIGFTDAIVSTSLENLKNTADITGQEHVGGIFGEWSAVTSSYNSTYTLELTEFENTGVITARGNYVGGIAGYMRFDAGNVYIVYMSECKNSGDVSGKTYVGGLIGYGTTDSTDSYVKDSSSSGGITAEAYVGCIAGQLVNITVDNCSNEGSTLNASKYVTESNIKCAYAGGFVGKGFVAKNCTNTVDINYTSEGRYVGGIMGYTDALTSTSIDNLKNTANITGQEYVGGILGAWNAYTSSYNSKYTADLTAFENSGSINARGNYVGGIVGYMRLDAHSYYIVYMNEFKNVGDINGQTYVGGLLGYAYSDSTSSTIQDYTSTGAVTGTADFDNIAGKLENITIK